MRPSQALYVVPKSAMPERDPRGLEPYLALEPRPKSNERANGIDWLALTAVVGSSVAGALVMWGIGHLIYRVIVGAWL